MNSDGLLILAIISIKTRAFPGRAAADNYLGDMLFLLIPEIFIYDL